MKTANNGKGSKPRPVDKKQYDSNYDRIFNKESMMQISNEDLEKMIVFAYAEGYGDGNRDGHHAVGDVDANWDESFTNERLGLLLKKCEACGSQCSIGKIKGGVCQ